VKKVLTWLGVFLCTSLIAKDVNDEFRATWVITWEYMSGSRSTSENMARIRHILDEQQKANMNAVLWQVRQGGTSYYISTNEPWGPYTGYKDPGFDPLAYAIEEAHKRGMEIHAWFNTFQTSEMVAGAPAYQHPEWVCRNSSGQPMASSRTVSPGLKQVRDYTVQVAMDIVRRYDIDGLHLDYVRWSELSGLAALQKSSPEHPQLDGMISAQDLQALNSTMASPYLYDVDHPYSAGIPVGFSMWEDWWRWSVTEFVHTLHDSIHAAKPWVRLSAAAIGAYNWGGWQGYGSVYQDAALWFNKGYVDQLMPMHYGYYSGYEFLNILVNGCPQCWGAYIQEGVAAGRLFSAGPGSYLLSQEKLMARHADIVSGCRQVSWVDGFQFFSYGSWEDNDFFTQAGLTFFKNKTKIRAAKFLLDAVPPAPGMIAQKQDSLHYRLQITPPAGLNKDQWYVIYRLAEGTTSPQPEILQVRFSHTPFDWVDSFSGMQDYNKRYTYYATLCDRFWNESIHSVEFTSDPIPSFAPKVLATLPVAGDTTRTKSPVKLTFSKAMDPLSFQNGIAFQPPVTIGSVLWSVDQRTCTITPAYGFTNNMSYTLLLAPAVKDVNGVGLDGNGDGKPGDSYKLNFVIESRDMSGPQVLSMYPAADAVVAPEEVLCLVFDEPLATASVNDNTVLLSKGGQSVSVAYNLTRSSQKCILSLQPKNPLEVNSLYSLDLSTSVTDTLGNALAAPVHLSFRTGAVQVKDVRYIDQFTAVANWKAPSYSGSTVGLIAANSSFALSTETFLPNVIPSRRNAAALTYAWDTTASSFLLREYMDVASAAAAIKFDSTYTLQCYVFGDASATLFRFAVDDGTAGHEVSQWIRVDWYGWRLVEWRLGNPASFGSWIGDGQFSSNQLNMDSIQLTRSDGSAWSGKIYFDDLRAVKKFTSATAVTESAAASVTTYTLQQNYPNPFNSATMIRFSLPEAQVIELAVYDLLGRQVALLADGSWPAGAHAVSWDATQVPTGVYMYQLRTGRQTLTRRMLLMR
jgi:uncharacterized lipoprotein YddW (UPF0748 family)